MDYQTEYILKIAKEGSISSAAEKCSVSQSCLSQILKRTEEEYGIKLFERSPGKKVIPTYAGEQYIKTMLEIDQLHKNLITKFKEINEDISGRLSLGIARGYNIDILPTILPKFIQAYPNVELGITRLNVSILNEKILNRTLDLAITYQTDINNELSYIPLPRETMVLIASKSFVINEGSVFSSVAKKTFIQLPKGFWIRERTDDIFLSLGQYPSETIETNDLSLVCAMVQANMGYSIVPSSYIASHLRRWDIPYYPISIIDTSHQITICYRKDVYLSSYMRYIIDLIKGWKV